MCFVGSPILPSACIGLGPFVVAELEAGLAAQQERRCDVRGQAGEHLLQALARGEQRRLGAAGEVVLLLGIVHGIEETPVVVELELPVAHDPRRVILVEDPLARRGTALTRCLGVSSAWVQPQGLLLELAVEAPCPSDLALKLVFGGQPERVDLMFDGLLSPALLRDEQVYSWHALQPSERRALREHGLALGVIRANGAPPEPMDPRTRPVVVIQ